MRVHEHRMVSLHHLAELRRDALGEMTGDAAPDPDDLDVRYRAQGLEEVLETPVGQHHRVAAAQDDIADLAVRAKIRERGIVLIERDLLGGADFAKANTE